MTVFPFVKPNIFPLLNRDAFGLGAVSLTPLLYEIYPLVRISQKGDAGGGRETQRGILEKGRNPIHLYLNI